MALKDRVAERRRAVVDRWRRAVVETYPADAGRFMGQARDPFANPVGDTLSRELPWLFDAALGHGDPPRTSAALESVVKLRSVQDFTASQAVSFIFLLKAAIREELGGAADASAPREWADLDAGVDALALSAFDVYAANRERMCDIRINAMRKRTFMLEQVALGLAGSGREDSGP